MQSGDRTGASFGQDGDLINRVDTRHGDPIAIVLVRSRALFVVGGALAIANVRGHLLPASCL
jgi:hypothetical protein